MTMLLLTPTRTAEFSFKIVTADHKIIITTQNESSHDYKLRALRDLYIWLKNNCNGNWVYLGSRGEEESPNKGTVEEWARSDSNPAYGFYGLTSGRKGRFASYIPSILEYYQFVELEHKKRDNRVRAL